MFRRPLFLAAFSAFAPVALAQNQPPQAPVINEPTANNVLVHPQDVHMETLAFSDPNPGDTHTATDWEIRQASNNVRVWRLLGGTGPNRVHVHLADGVFEGPLAGWTQVAASSNYVLWVRHKDSSGDAATEWSAWSTRTFRTSTSTRSFPLELDDVADVPEPLWTETSGVPVDLPHAGPQPAELRLEAASGPLLLRIQAQAASGNAITNPPAITAHLALRVVVESGSQPLVLPPTNLRVAEQQGCEVHTLLLPSLNLAAGSRADYWITIQGTSYLGTAAQTAPVWTLLARGPALPWVSRQVGYEIEEVAGGLRLPVNVAFHPNAANAGPQDPYLYVTELYGTIKTVLRDGTVLTYASGLLNYTPNGAFPGEGEQGLTGIAVDPVSGDLFAARLARSATSANNEPGIVRLSSLDGGRTSASRVVILNMPGEWQGQSHQISNLEIVNGRLYAHMGDGFDSATAQNLSSFRGKILCLELSGAAAPTNPFYDVVNGITARDYVWCYGVRNPFGGALRASDGFRYVVENGPSIDRFARLVQGRNYLWNGSDQSMTNFALYTWNPASGPVNLAFVQPQSFGGSGFPAAKQGRAYVTESGATYATGPQSIGKKITEWVLDANGNRVAGPIPFVEYVGTGQATAVGLAAGPDGLYFTELYRDAGGAGPTAVGARLLRVRFSSRDDCDGNGLHDTCEIATGSKPDCNGNSFPDGCDLASGRSRDYDRNGRPDECDALSADRDEVSLAQGAQVSFSLHPDLAYAGRPYFLVGSASGTQPGTVLDGLTLPLNLVGDEWFRQLVLTPNTGLFQSNFANLDGAARASATLLVPAGSDPILAGVTLHHAYVLFDPANFFSVSFASNALPLRLTP
jgi:glucose/arabinose dehydrogenase